MRKNIRISESQMKRIITESTKKVLKEAYIGRGKSQQLYGTSNLTSKENPYESDALLMLADRFEKILNKNDYGVEFSVDCYNDNFIAYDENYPKDYPKNGLMLRQGIFAVKATTRLLIDDIMLIFTTAKKFFGKNLKRYPKLIDTFSVQLVVDVDSFLRKEPRRDMIPQKPNFQTNGITNHYSYAKY